MSGNASLTPSMTASVETPPVLRTVIKRAGPAVDRHRIGLNLIAVVDMRDVANEHRPARPPP